MPSFKHGEIEIAFLDEGEGEPIVLVHGFASNKEVNWVYPGWVSALTRAGRRVIALDNRGHGASTKLYDPAAYHSGIMAEDVRALIDHLGLPRADVMGYSLGARIAALLALAHPERVRAAVLGGLGIHLVEGAGLPQTIAEALEAPTRADVSDPTGHTFRAFAEQTRSDLRALAACIRGSRQTLSRDEVGRITVPASGRRGRQGSDRRFVGTARGARIRRTGTCYSRPRPHARGRRQGIQGRRIGFPGAATLRTGLVRPLGLFSRPKAAPSAIGGAAHPSGFCPRTVPIMLEARSFRESCYGTISDDAGSR